MVYLASDTLFKILSFKLQWLNSSVVCLCSLRASLSVRDPAAPENLVLFSSFSFAVSIYFLSPFLLVSGQLLHETQIYIMFFICIIHYLFVNR